MQIQGNFIAVRAVPSIAEQQRMAKEEAARVEVQRKDLGPEGLATKGEELAHAMATNELPPPQELLTIVPIPDVTNITALPSTIYERANEQHVTELQKKCGIDLRQFPVNVTACDIHTTFGYVSGRPKCIQKNKLRRCVSLFVIFTLVDRLFEYQFNSARATAIPSAAAGIANRVANSSAGN